MMCKTKRPIMILTIALTLFLAWGITGTGKKAQALCDLENTTGITVYENVILSEHEKENYRKYAIQEKYSDTFCSGYRTLSETRTPIDFSKGGVMIEVPATGESTTIRLLETWHSEAVDTIPWGKAGGFSIIGQPIMEDIYFNVSTDNWSKIVPDYQIIEFTFGDIQSEAYIKIKVRGANYATAYVSVSGQKADGTYIETGETLVNTSFYGPAGYVVDKNGISAVRNVPLLLNFDPANPQFYGVITNNNSIYKEFSLAGIEADLPKLENYYVDMTFANKSQKNSAKFFIYELCTQNLSGTEIVDTTAPVISELTAQEHMVKNNAYGFEARAFDIIENVITDKDAFEYVVERKRDSAIIPADGEGQYYFDDSGEYIVSVTAKDTAGNISSVYSIEITVEEEDLIPPEISVQGKYRDSYYIGEEIEIVNAVYKDNVNTVKQSVLVYVDSEEAVINDGKVLADRAGTYEIVYLAEDASGNKDTKIFVFDVFAVEVPQRLEYDYSTGTIYLPQPIIPDGWYYKIALYHASDTEKKNPLALTDGGSRMDAGEYRLVYSLISDAKEEVIDEFEINITVKSDTEKPEIRILGEYAARYQLGDTVNILSAIATDNSGECILEVKIYLDGDEIPFENNALVIEQAGKYIVKYIATDAYGNIAETEKGFVVEKSGTEAWKIALIIGAVSVFVAAICVGIVVVKKRYGKQKNEE